MTIWNSWAEDYGERLKIFRLLICNIREYFQRYSPNVAALRVGSGPGPSVESNRLAVRIHAGGALSGWSGYPPSTDRQALGRLGGWYRVSPFSLSPVALIKRPPVLSGPGASGDTSLRGNGNRRLVSWI